MTFTKMSTNLDVFRVKIKHAQDNSMNGYYYFRERQDAEEYIRKMVNREIQEFADAYFNGCDGCLWCCYGDLRKKEWCEIISRRKPQTLHDCLRVRDSLVSIDLDLVTWESKQSSNIIKVEEIWNLSEDLLMQKLSSTIITC